MAGFQKLKQFRELRSQAKELQNQLSQETVHVDRMGGKIALVMDGNQKVLSLHIDPALVTNGNAEDLSKELSELFNDGVKKVQRAMAQKMAKEGKLDLSSLLKSKNEK